MYNYNKIEVITTQHGDKVITMSEEIFTEMIVALYEGRDHQSEDNRKATAEHTQKIINSLNK